MSPWVSVAALLVTVVAVGEVLVRSFTRPRLRAWLPGFERFALSAGLGFCVLTWWGLGLAQASRFSVAAFLGLPAAGAALVMAAWRLRRADRLPPSESRLSARNRRDGFGWTAAAALCVIGATLYFPPFDVRLEARDPGVYYLTGVQIAKEGAVAIIDPVVTGVPLADRAFWFTAIRTYTEVEALRFLGFTIENRDTGRVIPQALPALPVWIGFGYATGGPPWALRATGVLAIVGLCQIFVLTRRWVDPFAACVAAGLLAISFPQMWFAKFAAAEVLAQGLLAAAAYGWLMFRRGHGGAFGLLAAMGFGLSWLAKAELLLTAAPLAMVFCVDLVSRRIDRRALAFLWGPLALLGLHTAAHARFWSWPYYSDLLAQARINARDPMQLLWLAIAGCAVVAAPALLLVVVRWLPSGWRERSRRLSVRWLPATAAVATAAGLAWGYWLRPAAFVASMREVGRYITTWEALNVVELGWALTPYALVLAPVGAFALLRTSLRRRGSPIWVLGPFVPVSIIRRQIWSYLPWAYRRWLPIVLPMMAIALGAALSTVVTAARKKIANGTTRDVLLGSCGILVVAVVLFGTAVAAWEPTARYQEHEELPGTLQLLIDLLDALPPENLVLFETRTNRGLTRWEAVLDIERDRRVLRLQQAYVPIEYIRRLMRLENRANRSTYLLTTGLINTEARLGGHRVKEIEFETQRLRDLGSDRLIWEGLPLEPPTFTEPQRFRFRIYELDLVDPAAPLDGQLDVGDWDDLYLAGPTLHEAERDAEGRTFRWTNGNSGFYLPGLDTQASELVVEADADTPDREPMQTMQVALDGVVLGTVELIEGWTAYRFPLPAEWQPGAVAPFVQIRAPSFRPVDHDPMSTDERPLAVKVSRISWR